MDLVAFREHCLALPKTEETLPFGPDVLVYKVCGKVFALAGLDAVPSQVNLKCDPERALDLREQYPAIIPGYHMNKRHWNTLILNGSLSQKLILELLRHSYDLVVKSLPKKLREELL